MKTPSSVLSRVRLACFAVISIAALTQVGCSAAGPANSGGWMDSRREDLSKIFVYAVAPSPNLQLPAGRGNAPQVLTQAIQQQLAEANMLQPDERVHSLSLYGVMLSYQDGVIEAQGELYDDEQFLVYSRVKRRLDPNEDWQQGLNLVAEQMLDELMVKLHPGTGSAPPPCRQGDYGCRPILIESCGVTGCPQPGPTIYLFDSFCFNCWRDRDHGHDDHDQPRPKPHWVSGAILESLPRSSSVGEVKAHRLRGAEQPADRPSYPTGSEDVHTGGGSTTSRPTTLEPSSGGSGGSSTGPIYVSPRTPDVERPHHPRSDRGTEASTHWEPVVPTRSEPVYKMPKHREVEPPQSAPVVHDSLPVPDPERSVPAYEPPRHHEEHSQPAPVMHESVPAPRVDAPARSVPVESPRSESVHSSPPVMHESAPRSHESSSGSSSSSSSSDSSGGHGHGHRRE